MDKYFYENIEYDACVKESFTSERKNRILIVKQR